MQAKNSKKKVYLILGVTAASMLILEICFAHPHHHRLWNVVPGADILLGFGGAWLLIFLGKIVMNKLLRRSEDYYAAEDAGPEKVVKTTGVGLLGDAAKKAMDDTKNEQKAGGTHE